MYPIGPVLTELYDRSAYLEETHRKLTKKQKTIYGRLPIVRTRLEDRQIKLNVRRMKLDVAKAYLTSRQYR